MDSQNKIKNELIKLDREIFIAKWLAAIIMGWVIFEYYRWFYLVNGFTRSLTPGDWGTFGDYVGGLLNPVMGFFALYWLTRSVKIQRQELAETKDALLDSARSQQLQVNLAALTALTNSINAEVEMMRGNSIYYCDQLKKQDYGSIMNLDGSPLSIDEAKQLVLKIYQEMAKKLGEGLMYQDEIKAILKQINAEQLSPVGWVEHRETLI